MQVDPIGARESHTRAFSGFEAARDLQGQLLSAAAILNSHYYEYNDFTAMDPWIAAIKLILARGAELVDNVSGLTVYSALLLALTFRQPGHALLPRCVERVNRMLDAEVDVNQKVVAAIALLTYLSFSGEFALGRPLISRIEPLISASQLTALNQAYWSQLVCYHYHLLGEKLSPRWPLIRPTTSLARTA